MSGGATAERSERWERSPPIVGGPGGAAGLVSQAAALGVRLEARQGGRLWADKPDRLPPALRAGLAAHRAEVLAALAGGPTTGTPGTLGTLFAHCRGSVLAPSLPGVPPDWREGAALLTRRPAPDTIPPRRWAVLTTTATRLLQDHGAELHAAGWNALDVFGLHATAPAANPPGWGLAWLLGAHGEVLDVSPDAVGLRRYPDGARLTYRRRSAMAQAGAVPAWDLAAGDRAPQHSVEHL